VHKSAFAQYNQGRDIDNIFFLGEQKIESVYVVTFLPFFNESIIIEKSELTKIQNHRTFHTVILQAGAFFINGHTFYFNFIYLFYNSNLLAGRNDSTIFMNYCKKIADDANLNPDPYKYGPFIINNNFMQVRQIYEERFFAGVARIDEFNNHFRSEAVNYSLPDTKNLYVKFLVPLRDVPLQKE